MNIKILLYTFLFFSCLAGVNVSAQTETLLTTGSGKKSIIFKIPEGLPAPFNKDRKGFLFLNKDKPSGVFVVYTPDNQKSEDFLSELKIMFAEMFIHNDKGTSKTNDLKWSEGVLPVHKDTPNETGKIFTTSSGKYEVQFLAYVRTISEGQDIIYGYFAMRNSSSKKDSADFADVSGNGIKVFDKFWKTIQVSNK